MLPKRYKPNMIEPDLQDFWQESGIYHFDPSATKPVFSIDTPPPTVSGNLHLGHTFSYSHPDFIARFYRMNGYNRLYGHQPRHTGDEQYPTTHTDRTRQCRGKKGDD